MALTLMYITNNSTIATIAQSAGVDRVWIDMEYIGKELRQGGLDTVQSHHTIGDIERICPYLTSSILQVRINPIHDKTAEEIEATIKAGAEYVMLPYFRKTDEVKQFIDTVAGRAKTMILVETKEAAENIESFLDIPGIDEVHIGLNDLHLDYGQTFMFELLVDGTVERLCNVLREREYKYGFGGIARIGYGDLPAEHIIAEHYRLGSSMAILARAFCYTKDGFDEETVRATFTQGIQEIRQYESFLSSVDSSFFENNRRVVYDKVTQIVNKIKK